MSRIFKPVEARSHLGGTQDLYQFDNGYGASVVRNPFSYGGKAGLFELAVLDNSGELAFDTPVTDNVLGWLTETQVDKALAQIAALEATP